MFDVWSLLAKKRKSDDDRSVSASSILQMKQKSKRIRHFGRDEDGAIAIIFAIVLIPLLALVGAAIDYSRTVIDRSQTQDALDAAVLAAVKQVPYLTDGELRNMVESFVNANIPSSTKVNIDLVEISRNPNTIKVWASGSTEMTMMKLVKVNELDFKAKSKAEAGNQSIEVVMVLDNSGSMGSSMGTLKAASKDLVNTLEAHKKSFKSLKIGVVPFNHLVRADTGRENAKWLDQNAVASLHRKNLPPNSNRFELFKTLRNPYNNKPEVWGGCMEARKHPYDVKDTAPTSGQRDSYFLPYFYPDTREYYNSTKYWSSKKYLNDYLPSYVRRGKPDWTTWNRYGEYRGQKFRKGRGPNYYCYIPRMQPLTDNLTTVRNKLNGMNARGYTNIHMGTIWGLRLLSPQEPYTQGASYSDVENRKFLIVMTDGANTYSSHYQAYGWSSDGRISGSGSIQREMNKRTSESCTEAKNNKVEVFTIAYNNPGWTTEQMMRQCASNGGDGHYFKAQNRSQLMKAFEEIAKAISKVRLTE